MEQCFCRWSIIFPTPISGIILITTYKPNSNFNISRNSTLQPIKIHKVVAEDRIQLSAKLPKLIEALLLLLLTEFAVSPGLRGSGVEALLDSLLITLLWLEGAGPHTAEEL